MQRAGFRLWARREIRLACECDGGSLGRGRRRGIFGAVCRCNYRRRKPSASIRPMENSAQEYAGR